VFSCYLTIVDPEFTSMYYRANYDFTGYNIPFGIALIVIGIIFISVIASFAATTNYSYDDINRLERVEKVARILY